MSGRRGSILAQVLILTAVASLMCAAILRSRLQPALTTAGAVDRVQDDLAAQAAVNRVTEVWMRRGACGTDGGAGVLCAGVGCDCACNLLSPETRRRVATVSSTSYRGVCRLTASRYVRY